MQQDIQHLVDMSPPGKSILLPMGEFEGPLHIRKPCTLVGSSTTLWKKRGPVVVVESTGVTLQNLRIEVTDNQAPTQDFVSVKTGKEDTRFDEVEVVGAVLGVKGEEEYWDIPRVLSLGDFPANTSASMVLHVEVPVSVVVASTVRDLSVSPRVLHPGRNTLTITTEKLKDSTYIYGELLFTSTFLRRIYLSGSASQDPKDYTENRVIYQAKKRTTKSAWEKIVPEGVKELARGQRVPLKDVGNHFSIRFSYNHLLQPMELDPYVFLLDKNKKAEGDHSLVFFGKDTSSCGGVRYQEQDGNQEMVFSLDRIPESVQTVTLAYSIYGDNPNHNFSKVIEPQIQVFVKEEEKLRYQPKDLLVETTLVIFEIYRYQKEWRLNAIGAGYREGLKKLCESLGLTVVS